MSRWTSLEFYMAAILYILAVELTLRWNSVSGVYDINSTGQIIPLATGVSVAVVTLWKLIVARKRAKVEQTDDEDDIFALPALYTGRRCKAAERVRDDSRITYRGRHGDEAWESKGMLARTYSV